MSHDLNMQKEYSNIKPLAIMEMIINDFRLEEEG